MRPRPSHHEVSAVDPKSLFLMNTELITVGNGKRITVDDVLYGYDIIFEAKKMFLETRWLGVLNMQDPTGTVG